MLAGNYFSRKIPHLIQNHSDFFLDILAINQNRIIRKVTKCSMKNSSAFCFINFSSGKHAVNCFLQLAFFRKLQQKCNRFLVNQIFRIIEKEIFFLNRKIAETLRVQK